MSIVSSEMCVLSKLYGGNTTSFAKVWLKKGPFSSVHPMLITSPQKGLFEAFVPHTHSEMVQFTALSESA